MQLAYSVRLNLIGGSLIGALTTHAHYKSSHVSHLFFQDLYTQMIMASRRGDLASLYRDKLKVFAQNHEVEIDVDLSNLQFMGAQTDLPPFFNGYEPDILALIKAFLPADGVFYDAGSNWGYFTFHLLLDPEFEGKVVAFEPVTQSANDLVKIAEQIGLPHRVEMIPYAVGAEAASMMISEDAWSGNQSVCQDGAKGAPIEVRAIDSLGLTGPSMIKFDVENYEFQALKGCVRTLKECSPFVIFENWWSSEQAERALEPINFLNDLGYQLYVPEFEIFGADTPDNLVRKLPFTVEGNLSLKALNNQNRHDFPARINIFAVHAQAPRHILDKIDRCIA